VRLYPKVVIEGLKPVLFADLISPPHPSPLLLGEGKNGKGQINPLLYPTTCTTVRRGRISFDIFMLIFIQRTY